MIQENNYDSFLVSLFILYSLTLVSRWENIQIELWIVIDYQTGDYYYPVIVDDHVVNWDGKVIHRNHIPDSAVIETVYLVERDPTLGYASNGQCGPKILRKVLS
jgi:hypothetical protein